MAHEFITTIGENEVVLNNVPMRVYGTISYSLENAYGRKIHQGDPGPNDHPINSTITQARWTGGIGTLKYKGDSTQDNSWFSTFDTTIEESLALPVKTDEFLAVTIGEDASFAYPHQKLNGVLWATFGKKIKHWDEDADTWDDPPATGANTARSTAGTPSGEGVVWGPVAGTKKLYIPMGTDNLEVFDGAAVPTVAAADKAISFVVWEQKLIKVDSSGVVKSTTDGTTWTVKGQLADESTPKKLVVFKNPEGKQVVHLTTSSQVWALDYINGTLIETDMDWPDHPYQGNAAERWRADLYASVGIGIHRNVGGQIQAVGPDGRDGLPEEYSAGYFTGMRGAYNELWGVIKGTAVPPVDTETADLESGPPDRMLASVDQSFSMLIAWNGLGWHVKWIGTREPTTIQVASHSGIYRVFWGAKGAMYTKQLPIGYYNPAHSGETSLAKERTAYHETPYFNWGFDDTPKIMKQFEIKAKYADVNNYINLYYRIDDEVDWRTLGTITETGEHHVNIGFEEVADRTFHVGLPHERIQFRFEGHGNPDDEIETPIIQWFTLVGRKWMRMVRTFRFRIDNTQPHHTDTRKIDETIFEATTKKGGSTLVIGDQTYVVDITSTNASLSPDKTFTSYPSLVAVELTEVDNENAIDAEE